MIFSVTWTKFCTNHDLEQTNMHGSIFEFREYCTPYQTKRAGVSVRLHFPFNTTVFK
jgi:hypothetical protein